MSILTVNVGSSSVRLVAYGDQGKVIVSERYEAPLDAAELLSRFLRTQSTAAPAAIGHRIVHGGAHLTAACRVDAAVEAEIAELGSLAPLHNPAALAWLRACRAVFGKNIPQVAVFDTAFYADLPAVASSYALPQALTGRLRLRRYGFHGLAHQSMQRQWSALQADSGRAARVISLQLGAGCSITAMRDGRAIDTSMGFSPLEGLVMATRSGDVDAGLLLFLVRQSGYSPERLEELLNAQSGLLGVSGLSGDLRVLLPSSDARAQLAVDLYCYRARKYLGAYMAALGVDAILFGGGAGEHLPELRQRILAGMSWCEVTIDERLHSTAMGRPTRISKPDSRVQVWVMPVDESVIVLAEVRAVLGL
jgi:acetate kinase